MNRFLHYAVFIAGLAAVVWVGAGYVGNNPLALAITGLVAAFYLVGALELHRFQQATSTLSRAVAQLGAAPADLGAWLAGLHPSLQNAVRLRIEGERVGLPGPALTPYLAGLLVLLGMLGTFLGMVVTLNGTGLALESATDLQAIRASLSAPVRGLGLAFGTSVAGVAASAMLGLWSALCRRERVQAGQLLDSRIATSLRVHSSAYRREETFRLLQLQAQALPALVDRLQAMVAASERQSEALNERLVTSQDRFHGRAEAVYAELAASVGRSLQQSLTESARIAGATIQPVVETTMAGIARETGALHQTVAHTVQQQLDGMSGRFEAATAQVAHHWDEALADHRRTSEALAGELREAQGRFAETFADRSSELVDAVSTRFAEQADALRGAVARSQGELQTRMAASDAQRLAAWNESLAAMAAALQREWQQAGTQAAERQQVLTETLARTAHEMSAQAETHAKGTVAEVAQLLQAAAEAPRAAAEVIAELRQKLSDSMARDNTMLEERGRILETLATLLDGVNHASTEQRAAVDALVATTSEVLERVGGRFTAKVEAETDRLAAVSAQVTGSAVEVASLGEAFGLAVQIFSESNEKLGAQLQRIEGALGKSIARSDEQLAYYVAQAREVVDLSVMSQKQMVEDMQRLTHARAAEGSAA
ncbi:DUF802 domain-containing protein [Variovorax sp. J22P168]|uniref:DUF802 domain-containing protein n=1 Tax=Variovorax jilinensis TaxID=3053513 RepID=UPI0025774078|nr:DUF802 domain-containing protein [Variovorax sp. J22P168]MDM0015641.1 DUF802 domain-containing protein [Variovorax sp. J22P168]